MNVKQTHLHIRIQLISSMSGEFQYLVNLLSIRPQKDFRH